MRFAYFTVDLIMWMYHNKKTRDYDFPSALDVIYMYQVI